MFIKFGSLNLWLAIILKKTIKNDFTFGKTYNTVKLNFKSVYMTTNCLPFIVLQL